MKRWWRLWGGHVFTVSTMVAALVALYFFREAARATDGAVTFLTFVIALLASLLALALGAIATYLFRTPQQRWYIRHEVAINSNDLPPVDGAAIVERDQDTQDASSLASEAHSAQERASRAE